MCEALLASGLFSHRHLSHFISPLSAQLLERNNRCPLLSTGNETERTDFNDQTSVFPILATGVIYVELKPERVNRFIVDISS